MFRPFLQDVRGKYLRRNQVRRNLLSRRCHAVIGDGEHVKERSADIRRKRNAAVINGVNVATVHREGKTRPRTLRHQPRSPQGVPRRKRRRRWQKSACRPGDGATPRDSDKSKELSAALCISSPMPPAASPPIPSETALKAYPRSRSAPFHRELGCVWTPFSQICQLPCACLSRRGIPPCS